MSGEPPLSALYVVMAIPLFWIAVGLVGLFHKAPRFLHARLYFLLGAAGGVVLAMAAFPALSADAQSLILPLGLPDLPFHLRVDSLSAFFLILLGAVSAGISRYAAD
jgi:hydrogenase-4 component B